MQATPGRPDRSDRGDRFDRPRFRQDLVAETVDEQGARFIDVMDPDSGNIFRFYEVEYSLACGMDGERDVAGIVKWAQDELGLTPSQHEVRTVIATLGDLGFIDAGEASEADDATQLTPELAPGVVAAPSRPYPPTDVELGGAGGSAPRGEPLPAAPSLALGVPGATGRRPAEPAGDVELGAPGARAARPTPRPTPRPMPVPPTPDLSDSSDLGDSAFGGDSGDVSIDLSDHVAVRRDDVKEAVRASKVMTAVEGPLFDAVDERPPARALPSISRPPEPARQQPGTKPKLDPRITQGDAMPEAKIEVTVTQTSDPRMGLGHQGSHDRVGKAPLTRTPDTRTGKAPVELPRPPHQVEKAPVPDAPSARTSPALLVIFIVALLGGGAFLAWRYLLQNPDTEVGTTSAPPSPAVKPVAPPPPPPPPPAPASKIVLDAPSPDDIKSPRAGLIETILADKTTVKAGDVIVKLVGDKPIEAEITGLTRDEKRIQDLIDASTKRRDAAQAASNKADEAKATAEIADRQKALTAKQAQLATRTTDLDKFLLHATADGVFTPVAKPQLKVAADDVVAKLQRDAAPGATFAVTDATPFATNTNVELAVGKGEQHVTCTISDVQPDSIKVACPADPALTEGTDVTLKLPAAEAQGSAKPAAPAPAMPK